MINIIGLKQYKKDNAHQICIGSFDGFHKGHQALKSQSQYLVTFYPHPKKIVNNESFQLLTTLSEQAYLNKQRIVIPFNKQLSQLSADDFLNTIIKPYLNPSRIVVGYDFKYGAKQQGNIHHLQNWGRKNNCDIIEIKQQNCPAGLPYKTSRIKNELKINPNEALSLLGHPYLIIGKVVYGEGRGKLLGFPTANIQVPKIKFIPKTGVYSGYVIIKNTQLPAIIYIGTKPTFNHQKLSIEVHILNQFNQSIYGKYPKILITKFLRDDIKFNSKQALIQQIKKDIIIAQNNS